MMTEHGLTEESKDVCSLTNGDGLVWVQNLVKKEALAEAEARRRHSRQHCDVTC